jgi:hypothetical protein
MDVHCPHDRHFRTLNQNTGQISCEQRECQCGECYRYLTAQEQKDWRGHP